jgi:hypothetical protein
MSDCCEPVWAVDSDEMGFFFLILAAIVSIPYFPVGMFAYWLGTQIWDVKLVKWGMVILVLLFWHLFLVHLKENKGLLYASMPVLAEWLIFDLVTAQWQPSKMEIVQWSIDLFHWLFTA